MLWISIEKQRKRTPFFKFCLAREMPAFFEIMFGGRICRCYIRLVLKSKGNARLFSTKNWRTDGRGAGGQRGQTCQTEIYYRIVYFYCFKCFRILLKSKGHARLFSNFVWQRKCPQFLRNYVWRTDMRMLHTYDYCGKTKEMHAICFKQKYSWRTDGRATGGADPNATRNWCFVEADGVYFYCFSMIVQGFAEATTDTICDFYCSNKTSKL